MDEDQTRKDRIVALSPEAILDYAENHDHTARVWGWVQADRYSDMLDSEMEALARGESRGRPVEDDPTLLALFVKWHRAKYGHWIIYQSVPEGIYVLRILHSSMDLPQLIDRP